MKRLSVFGVIWIVLFSIVTVGQANRIIVDEEFQPTIKERHYWGLNVKDDCNLQVGIDIEGEFLAASATDYGAVFVVQKKDSAIIKYTYNYFINKHIITIRSENVPINGINKDIPTLRSIPEECLVKDAEWKVL